jgi:hypothetical protein
MASFFDSFASFNIFGPETKEVTAAKDTLKSIKQKCTEDIAKAEEGVTKAKSAPVAAVPAAVTPSTPAAPAAPNTGGKRRNRNKSSKKNKNKNKNGGKKRKTARK